jgi:hypothetical protein
MKILTSHRPHKSTDLYLASTASSFRLNNNLQFKKSQSTIKKNLNQQQENKFMNSNYFHLAKKLKTLKNNPDSNIQSKWNYNSNLNSEKIFNLNYEDLNFYNHPLYKSNNDPKNFDKIVNDNAINCKKNFIIQKSSNLEKKFLNSKNSLTVISKTTKENSMLINNSASPKKLIRSSFLMNISCNDIEGPEDLHFFNIVTSQNNKMLAMKFDRNQENLVDGITDFFDFVN